MLTMLETEAIGLAVEAYAMRFPDATGNIVAKAMAEYIPTAGGIYNPDLRIGRVLPNTICNGWRPWLHNYDTATRRGLDATQSLAYADEMQSAYWGKYDN